MQTSSRSVEVQANVWSVLKQVAAQKRCTPTDALAAAVTLAYTVASLPRDARLLVDIGGRVMAFVRTADTALIAQTSSTHARQTGVVLEVQPDVYAAIQALAAVSGTTPAQALADAVGLSFAVGALPTNARLMAERNRHTVELTAVRGASRPEAPASPFWGQGVA